MFYLESYTILLRGTLDKKGGGGEGGMGLWEEGEEGY